MKLLSRDQVVNAKDLVFRDVPTPEWAPEGATPEEQAEWGVRVRNLTAEGRGVFIKRTMEQAAAVKAAEGVDGGDAAPTEKFETEILLLAMTAIDADGNAMFTEADLMALGKRNAAAVMRCAAVAQELSGLSQAAKEKAAGK